MVDPKELLKEFEQVKSQLHALERQVQEKRVLYGALFNLLHAKGVDPNKKTKNGDQLELAAVPKTQSPSDLRINEIIKEATAELKGEPFAIDDIFEAVKTRMPGVARSTLSYALWMMSKGGQIRTVNKGKRGSPATYIRE